MCEEPEPERIDRIGRKAAANRVWPGCERVALAARCLLARAAAVIKTTMEAVLRPGLPPQPLARRAQHRPESDGLVVGLLDCDVDVPPRRLNALVQVAVQVHRADRQLA